MFVYISNFFYDIFMVAYMKNFILVEFINVNLFSRKLALNLNKPYSLMTYVYLTIYIYSQTCFIRPSKGTVKYGHIRQMVS